MLMLLFSPCTNTHAMSRHTTIITQNVLVSSTKHVSFSRLRGADCGCGCGCSCRQRRTSRPRCRRRRIRGGRRRFQSELARAKSRRSGGFGREPEQLGSHSRSSLESNLLLVAQGYGNEGWNTLGPEAHQMAHDHGRFHAIESHWHLMRGTHTCGLFKLRLGLLARTAPGRIDHDDVDCVRGSLFSFQDRDCFVGRCQLGDGSRRVGRDGRGGGRRGRRRCRRGRGRGSPSYGSCRGRHGPDGNGSRTRRRVVGVGIHRPESTPERDCHSDKDRTEHEEKNGKHDTRFAELIRPNGSREPKRRVTAAGAHDPTNEEKSRERPSKKRSGPEGVCSRERREGD